MSSNKPAQPIISKSVMNFEAIIIFVFSYTNDITRDQVFMGFDARDSFKMRYLVFSKASLLFYYQV